MSELKGQTISEKDFWYIAAQSEELRDKKPLGKEILGEWVVLFRDEQGKAVALQDRCVHRNAQLSNGGQVREGKLVCPYHGWKYDGQGQVVQVPSEMNKPVTLKSRCAKRFGVVEQEGYIYVCLNPGSAVASPFGIPCLGKPGYSHIRLINRFKNSVTNCAENFMDIPHTVLVHPGIFRYTKNEHFKAKVTRSEGKVLVTYHKETANFGFFSKILNPSGKEIKHSDDFHLPNVTHVAYRFGETRHFNITSQSIPISEMETLVYTDLTYNYGWWTALVKPLIHWQAQTIIDQDVVILANQGKAIEKYGEKFMNSECDVIHVMIESIRNEIKAGRDPRLLPERIHEIDFWV